MRSGPSRVIVALLTSLSIACGGRGCGSRQESAVATNQSVDPVSETSSVLKPVVEAQSSLGASLFGSIDGLPTAERVKRIEATFDAIKESLDLVPRDTFDPDAIVTSAQREPQRLLEWTARHTRLVPYRGVLRGPAGVLMDRSGNSLDRSLLLADLLKRSGVEARLAHATLSGGDLARMTNYASSQTPAALDGPRNEAEQVQGILARYARNAGGRPEGVPAAIQKLRSESEALRREVQRQAEQQTTTLIQLSGGHLAQVLESWKKSDTQALADHWWVQVEREGTWIDLDPAHDAWNGGAQPVPQETMPPARVPETLYHVVRIAVGIECACSDRLEERPVLEDTARVSDLVGKSISLRQVPVAQPPPDVMTRPTPHEAMEWMNAQEEWTSGLVIAGSVRAISNLTTSGLVTRQHPPASNSPAAGMLDAFGGGEDAPTSGNLTAEFVDYEIRSPGQATRTERRYLVDWIGSNARASGTVRSTARELNDRRLELAREVQILILGAQPSAAYVHHSAAQQALAERDRAVSAYSTLDREPGRALQANPTSLESFPAQLYALTQMRRALAQNADTIYIAELNILTWHEGLEATKEGPVVLGAFDIVANPVRARGTSNQSELSSTLNQGIADTHAELLLASAEQPATNIAAVMTRQSAASAWQATRTANGTLVVRPVGSDTGTGWWQIDLTRGTVMGMTPRGWGGTQMAEIGFTNVQTAARTMVFVAKMLATIVCAALVAVKAIKLKQSRPHYDEVAENAEIAAVIGVAGCLVKGMLTGFGGITTGTAGQVLNYVGNMFDLGLGFGALYYALSEYFGSANFSSR